MKSVPRLISLIIVHESLVSDCLKGDWLIILTMLAEWKIGTFYGKLWKDSKIFDSGKFELE